MFENTCFQIISCSDWIYKISEKTRFCRRKVQRFGLWENKIEFSRKKHANVDPRTVHITIGPRGELELLLKATPNIAFA
jgi:hypothetical protein